MEDKTIQDNTSSEEVKPYIHLEADDKGMWSLASNLTNPERHLRIIGAKLTLRAEE